MAKPKGNRIIVTLECTSCQSKGLGANRYTTKKNRKNTPNRLELQKYCSCCKGHRLFKEIK